MKIAQVAPLIFRVPPRKYGPIERIVSYLTEEFIRQGHELTMFASGDSATNARLISPISEPLSSQEFSFDYLEMAYAMLIELVARNADEFDVIHFHDRVHFPFSRRQRVAQVTTIHSPLDNPRHHPFHKEFVEMPLVSVSQNQRNPAPWLNWRATIHNGLPENLYTFREPEGKYLAFLGRLCPEKGFDKAIRIAKQFGMKLIAAGTRTNARYFAETMAAYKNDPSIEYLGEIGDEEKNDLLGNAYAFLFPIAWNEPFATVVMEALACGTPVVAFNCGSVAEAIIDGVNGFIVREVDEAVQALDKIPSLSRKLCRLSFEERFTVTRMCRDYMAVYEGL